MGSTLLVRQKPKATTVNWKGNNFEKCEKKKRKERGRHFLAINGLTHPCASVVESLSVKFG